MVGLIGFKPYRAVSIATTSRLPQSIGRFGESVSFDKHQTTLDNKNCLNQCPSSLQGCVIVLVGFSIILSSCVKHHTITRRQTNGTCVGACSHYTNCSDEDSDPVYNACLQECQFAFSNEGYEDRQTLGHLESLDCDEITSFVEGDSGRPPGVSKRGTIEIPSD